MSGHHLSLGLSRQLWGELLQQALPFEIATGEFTVIGAARSAWQQLGVRERVVGLLEEGRAPEALQRLGTRALEAWTDRRDALIEGIERLVSVEGTWRVEIDDLGTQLTYGPQKVAADAFVKAVVEGTVTLLSENLSFPFRVEQRVGASVALSRIRYSRDADAVIGNVQDLVLHLGDHVALRLLARLLEQLAEQRLDVLDAVPILKRAQVEGLFGPLGGGLRLGLGVEDLQLDVNEDSLTLQVRFGFSRLSGTPQLEEHDA